MAQFHVNYTGDYLDADGNLTSPDMAFELFADKPFIIQDFLTDQSPKIGDDSYWNRLYDLEITPSHVAMSDGLVILRPHLRAIAFAHGAERLTVVGRAGKGTDKIDLDVCTQNDVAVFNSPDSLTHATASAAFLFILALAKQLMPQNRLVQRGRWDLQPHYMGSDLTGKVLGIVGFGASGRELARLIQPWGMKILVFCPYTRADETAVQQAQSLSVTWVNTREEVFERADFVSLHNRLDETTRGSIGLSDFHRMKPQAYFINVARGEIVREREMVEALKTRVIAGAGLDVFEHEPIPANHPLVALDNVILTPHWLASTRDAAKITMRLMANGIVRSAVGLLPENIMNPQVLKRPHFQAKLARFAVNQST